MKKTARTKKLVADTMARIEETQAATQERTAVIFATYARREPLDLGTASGTIVRYLETAGQDALTRSRHISPEVADVKTHTLPAWQDLTATPVSRRTLAEVTDEITDYLGNEYRFAVPGMMHGLDDFLTWYQGTFLKSLHHLTEQKIATAETLGKTNAKKKLVEAFATLPSFSSPEAFDDYCRRILKRDAADPTDEIVQQWRQGKPSPFPPPEAFKTAFRRALKLDAEATAEVNGDGQTAAHFGYTAEDRKRDEKAAEHARQAAAKNRRELDAKSRGGKKGAKTRREEVAADQKKETIRREVNAKKAEWDRIYPNRHKPGNKDHSDNQIYKMFAKKHLKADGSPLYTWETIKSWYKNPKRAKKSGNK